MKYIKNIVKEKEKEEKLIKKIEESKIKLRRMRNKRLNEFGKLCCDYGLHNFDIKLVKQALSQLSKDLSADETWRARSAVEEPTIGVR